MDGQGLLGYEGVGQPQLAELLPMSDASLKLQTQGLQQIRARMGILGIEDPNILEVFLKGNPELYRIFAESPAMHGQGTMGETRMRQSGGEVYVDPGRANAGQTMAHELGHVAQRMAGEHAAAAPGLSWDYSNPSVAAIVAERGAPPARGELFPYWLEGSPMVRQEGLADLRQWIQNRFGGRR